MNKTEDEQEDYFPLHHDPPYANIHYMINHVIPLDWRRKSLLVIKVANSVNV